MLDKMNGMVFGVITENETTVGYHIMQNYQGKFIPMDVNRTAQSEPKKFFSAERYDYTTCQKEAYNFLMNFKSEKNKA